MQETNAIFSIIVLLIIGIFSLGFISFSSAQEFPELSIKVETVAENLKIPWEVDFAPKCFM